MLAGQLEIQLLANIARLISDMDKAKRTVSGAVDTMNSVLKTLGVGISIAGITAFMKSSIDSLDSLNDLRQATGLLGKDIAGLEMAFRQSGLDNSALQKTFVKLSQEIASGGKNLAQMGISLDDASGKAKTSRQIFGELADKIASYEDNAKKVNLVTDIFSAKLAGLIPVLNGGSASLDEYDKLAAKLGQTVSDKTLIAADRFNDTLDLISTASSGVSKQIVAEMLPTFMGLAEQFLTSATSGDRLRNIADFLSTALKGLVAVGIGVVGTFQTVGTAFGGVAAMWSAILSGEFTAAREIVKQTKADIATGFNSTLEDMKAAWSANGSAAVESLVDTNNKLKDQAILLQDLEKKEKEKEAARKKAAAEAKKQSDDALRIGHEYVTLLQIERKQREDLLKPFEDGAKKAADQLDSMRDEIESLDLSKDKQIDLKQAVELTAIARLEEKKAGHQDPEIIKQLNDEIETRKKIAELIPIEQDGRNYKAQREKILDIAKFLDKNNNNELEKLREFYDEKRLIILENTATTEIERQQLLGSLQQQSADAETGYYKSVGREQLRNAASTFNELAMMTRNNVNQNNALYKAAFAATKAFAIAETTISTYEGAQKAYTALAGIPYVGPALGFAAAGVAIAAGLARVANIASQSPGGGGAFHGGTDFVPKEQSYLLDRGERVLSPKQNQDLTSYLQDRQASGGNRSVVINMNLNMSGGGDEGTIRRSATQIANRTGQMVNRALARNS